MPNNDSQSWQVATAQAIDTASGYVNAANVNRKQRKWAEKMYDKQRQDTLADWNMTNEYNKPENVMKRYQDAGLNPNLIYGQGQQVEGVKQSDIQSVNFEQPPPSNTTGALMSYQTMQMQKQQIDNLKKQNDVLTAEALLKAAQTLNTTQSTESSKFELDKNKSTLSYDVDAKKLAVRAAIAQIQKTMTDTTATADANYRSNQLHPGSLKQQSADIGLTLLQQAKTDAERKQINANIKLLKDSHILNDFEIQLNKRGFTRSDDVKYRLANKLWDAISSGKSIEEAARIAGEEVQKSTGVNILPKWFRKKH